MRITCPNCDAGYDVPDKAIPQAGREVQCSACRHRWHQLPLTRAGQPETLTLSGTVDPEDEATPQPRRKLDPEVLAVLRQEATRETAAREAEGATTPDAPAPPPRNRPRTTESIRDRLARLQEAERAAQGTPKPKAAKAATTPDPKVPLEAGAEEPAPTSPAAPDTDHALAKDTDATPAPEPAPTPEPAAASAPQPAPRPREPGLPVALSSRELALIEERKTREGFRWGFAATLGACCVVLLIYLGAPHLSRQFPAASGTFDTVSARGEAIQTKLASQMRAALERLTTRPE